MLSRALLRGFCGVQCDSPVRLYLNSALLALARNYSLSRGLPHRGRLARLLTLSAASGGGGRRHRDHHGRQHETHSRQVRRPRSAPKCSVLRCDLEPSDLQSDLPRPAQNHAPLHSRPRFIGSGHRGMFHCAHVSRPATADNDSQTDEGLQLSLVYRIVRCRGPRRSENFALTGDQAANTPVRITPSEQ